uniref:GH18 domain-containing protein n=1 Tax=Anopheles epiroticus TaxID=199890 RepID=A0A182PVY1_9DIPT
MFVVNSVSFDIDKSTILSREDTIKRSNASADVLLTVVLPFNITIPAVQRQLSERISIVLRDNVLDGVDLDYDIALLDYYEQHRYGQFLRQLRMTLVDKYSVSTTIGCHTLGSSRSLLKSFNDHLDLISIVGVNMLEDELADRSKEEFMVREYETEYIERLIASGLHPDKLVLSVLTVGVVFNPGSYRPVRSPPRNQVGVLSYGQVCELLREKQAKCGEKADRPMCSLFAGRGAVVYDSEETVRIRTDQAHRLGVRGVLILPNYDDTEDRCKRGPFPLFRSLMEGVANGDRNPVPYELVCDGRQRYGDVEDGRIFYTFSNGRTDARQELSSMSCYNFAPTLEKFLAQTHDTDRQPGDVPFETFPNHREPWSSAVSGLVTELLHQLHVGRIRYGPYLHRYALLINAIETVRVLSVYALLTQTGWDHRLSWRPQWHIPKHLRINFALVVSLLTVYSNLAAIVGLLKFQPHLLWPYICLRLGTFVLELCYLMGKIGTFAPVPCLRKLDPNVCPNGSWWPSLMVVLVGCNLSIVIAVYLNHDQKGAM